MARLERILRSSERQGLQAATCIELLRRETKNPIFVGLIRWYGLCSVSCQVEIMAMKTTKIKTSTARAGTKTPAAPKKAAAAKKPAAKPATKSSSSPAKKRAQPGILMQAANAGSDEISGVAKPAKAGLKAGASTFLHEAANSIGVGKTAGTTTTAAAKPATKKAAAKPKAAAAKSKGVSGAKSGAKNTKTKTGRK